VSEQLIAITPSIAMTSTTSIGMLGLACWNEFSKLETGPLESGDMTQFAEAFDCYRFDLRFRGIACLQDCPAHFEKTRFRPGLAPLANAAARAI